MSNQTLEKTPETTNLDLQDAARPAGAQNVRGSLAQAKIVGGTQTSDERGAVEGLETDSTHRESVRQSQRAELGRQRVERSADSAKGGFEGAAEQAREGMAQAVAEVPDVVAGAGRLLSDVWSWGTKKARGAYEVATDFVQTAVSDPKAAIVMAKGAASVAVEKVGSGLSWTTNKLADAGEWIERNGARVLSTVGDIGSDLGKGVLAMGSAGISSVVGIGQVIIGQQSWSEYKTAVSEKVSASLDHFGQAKDAVVAGGAAVLGFAKSVSDAMGITDMAKGLWHLAALAPNFVWDCGQWLTGNCSWAEVKENFGKNLDMIGQGVFGGLTCFAEIVGIADLYRAGRASYFGLAAYGRHEYEKAAAYAGEAAFNGAFAVLSLGALAATVSTAGSAAGSMLGVSAARTALKQAGKEAFKVGAEQIGKNVIEKMGVEALQVVGKESGQSVVKELEQQAMAKLGNGASREAITAQGQRLAMERLSQETGEGIAKGAGNRLTTEVKKKGLVALLPSNVQRVCREEAEKLTETLLKKLKLSEHVEQGTYDLLKRLKTASPDDLCKELMESTGVSKRAAQSMVKNAKSALRRGANDKEIAQILEDTITKHVTKDFEKLMESSFKRDFRKALKGELDEPWSKELAEAVERRAKQLGKEVDEVVDDLVESGWKGAREGIENAVRKAVREGVLRGIKRFRDEEGRRRHLPGSKTPEEKAKKVQELTKPHEAEVKEVEVEKRSEPVVEEPDRARIDSYEETNLNADGSSDTYVVRVDRQTQQVTKKHLSHSEAAQKVAKEVQAQEEIQQVSKEKEGRKAA